VNYVDGIGKKIPINWTKIMKNDLLIKLNDLVQGKRQPENG